MKEGANAIMNIPLPKNHCSDQVLWHYDKKGEYSVKSGYHIARKLSFQTFRAAQRTKAINGR